MSRPECDGRKGKPCPAVTVHLFGESGRGEGSDERTSALAEEILQKIDMHLAGRAIPGSWPPGFGNDVDVTVAVHIPNLQFMTAELLIEDDPFAELQAPRIFPKNPARV